MTRAAVEQFCAGLHPTTRVLNRGTLQHPELGSVPAVRTLNSVYRQQWVWAYTARRRNKPPHGMEAHYPDSSYTPEET